MASVLNYAPIIILLFFVVVFTARGFLKSLMSFGKTLISFVIAAIFGPSVSELLADKVFGKSITGFVYDKLSSFYGSATEAIDLTAFFEKLDTDFAWVKGFGVDVTALEEKYGALTGASTDELYELSETIASPVVNAVSNLAAYIGLFIVSIILCIVLTFVLSGISDLVEKIPVAGKLNHWLGFFFGIATGIIAVVITVFAVDGIMQLISALNESFDYESLLEEAKIFKFIRDLNLVQYLKRN